MLITLFSLVLLAPAAHAERITECVPMGLRDGKVQIYANCNARAVNARWNLRLQPSGCAINWQRVQRGDEAGSVLQQGSLTREIGEGRAPLLPDCTDEEAITFLTS